MRLGFWSCAASPLPILRGLALSSVLASQIAGCFNPSDDVPSDGGSSNVASSGGDTTSSGGASETTTGDDTSTSQPEAASSSGGDAALEEACADYCGIIGDHCEDELAQYSGTQMCEAACARMPLGDPDDTLGNSVHCRSFHATLAARSPDSHCHHAGPAGDGTCGADCESFCSLALATCQGDLAPYPDSESCIAACQEFPTEPLYTAEAPDADTFACRLRHLTLATLQPEVHCSHVVPESPVCFD